MNRTIAVLLVLSIVLGGALFAGSTMRSGPDASVPRDVAPQSSGPFSFAAVGDLAWPGNADMVALSKRAEAMGASFLLALGDLGYTSDEQAWCNAVKSGINDVILVAGNHDSGESAGGNMSEYVTHCPFTLDVSVVPGPGTPGYGHEYYFDYPSTAPLARFIVVAAGIHGSFHYDYSAGSSHYNWVVGSVNGARSSGIPWVVVANHKTCINVGTYGCEMTRPLFDKLVDLKVDLILQAHYHSYQRSKQLALGTGCSTVPPNGGFDGDCIVDHGADGMYSKGAGSIVVTNGVGGQSMYDVPLNGSDAELGYVVHAMGVNGNTQGRTKGYGTTVFSVTATGISAETDFCPAGTTDGTGHCPSQAGSTFEDSFTIGGDGGGNGLVLSYDMETLAAEGKMKDLSGFERHGAIAGATDAPGKVGRARHFNAGDRITASAIPVSDANFTVAAWFNWTTNPSPHYTGVHGGGGSWELRILSNGRFGATFYQSTTVWTEIISPLAYNDGTWHHAAAVLRSGLVELYVDGVLVARDTTNPIVSVRTSSQTILGHVASDLVGAIDEVRAYSRALTAEEVAALVPPPPDGDLALSYDMQSLTDGSRMKDLSGNGRHGTFIGTTDVAGKIGRARRFSAGDRITAPVISVLGRDFTVAAWFNWTTNPSPHYSGIHGGNGSWELRILSNGRFGATFYQSTTVWTEIVSPLAYNDGTWHHAAAVLRSGLVELYVDGVLVAQDTSAPISSVRMSTQTILGQVASDFVGDIDEVRVYSRALTAGEVGALAGGPPQPGKVGTALAIGPTSPDPSSIGQSVSWSAVLTRADTGAPLAGKPVRFEASDNNGASWWNAGTYVTSADGRASGGAAFGGLGPKLVRAQFAGDANFLPSTSPSEPHAVNLLPASVAPGMFRREASAAPTSWSSASLLLPWIREDR